MATPRLYGPLPLTTERVDRHLQASSPGVYILGDVQDGLFVIGQLGRSDHDLRSALAAQVGNRFTHFKFRYALSAEDAFAAECELYHAVTLDNPIHPIAPEGMSLQCSRCRSSIAAPEPRIPHTLPSAGSHEFERRLRIDISSARREFMTASDQFDQLVGIALDSRGTADGVLARAQAKRLRDAAFQRYREALRRYKDFLTGNESLKRE